MKQTIKLVWERQGRLIAAIILVLTIFILDCITPISYQVSAFYLIPFVFFSLARGRKKKEIWLAFCFIVVLGSIGFYADRKDIPLRWAILNRLFEAAILIFSAIIIIMRNNAIALFEQTKKMEAIGMLIGGIVHDFNNSLAIILGNAELAMDELGDLKNGKLRKIEENIKRIFQAANQAKDITRRILVFSQKKEQRWEHINVTSLTAETFELLRSSIPKNIEMILDLKAEEDEIMGNPSYIQQIIMNLAMNSVHAMRKSDKKKLTIRLMNFETHYFLRFDVGELKPAKYVVIVEEDTGMGMDAETRKKIFDPLFTTKEEGTGLGLTIISDFVKKHEGAIRVETELGEGSTLSVFLPLAKEGKCKQTEEIQKAVFSEKERILVVEDEELVIEALEQMLERLGYTVTALTDPFQAVNLFQKDPYQFDIVFSDLVMPNLNGLELARKLLYLRKDIPVVIYTAHKEEISEDEIKEIGIKQVIEKPMTKKELLEVIHKVLES